MSEGTSATAKRTPFSGVAIVEPSTPPESPVRAMDPYRFKPGGFDQLPDAEAYANDPDKLHNDFDPYQGRLHEKPEHRMMIYLKAQGLTNKEIAERTGYSAVCVGEVLRQPWARLQLVKELKEAGQDAIQAVIKGEALNSVFDIVDIRNDPATPKAVRLAANNSILDRFLGKAVQKVEVDERRLPATSEISKLQHDIAEIDKQLNDPPPATGG